MVAPAPRPLGIPGYPRHFDNREGLPLKAQAPITHHPLLPKSPWKPGTEPGAVRAMYNDGNRADFDVAWHDEDKGATRSGNWEFSLAKYHPKKRSELGTLG